jgi:hypothetical protein
VTFPSGRHTSRPDDFCNSFLFDEMDDFDDEGSSYINHFIQPDTIIPDPSGPQTFNRYSYVENRPINFNDPTGHNADCGIGDSICQVKPSNKLLILDRYKYLVHQVKNEKMNDREAFAQLTEYAASLTPNCTECFVNNVGSVVTGVSNSHPSKSVMANREGEYSFDWYYQATRGQRLGQSGYDAIFKDPGTGNNGNQARHFWFYVQAAYHEGDFYAVGGNFYHEFVDKQETKGHSFNDYALGVEGRNLGMYLGLRIIKPSDVGNFIRNTLEPNSGAAGKWEHYERYLNRQAHPRWYDSIQTN